MHVYIFNKYEIITLIFFKAAVSFTLQLLLFNEFLERISNLLIIFFNCDCIVHFFPLLFCCNIVPFECSNNHLSSRKISGVLYRNEIVLFFSQVSNLFVYKETLVWSDSSCIDFIIFDLNLIELSI